ncbi:MAG: TIGR04372 family glycosyltransferase [Gammaproteobacteria bacterium]
MKALLRRVKNVANDRVTRVLFYDQTQKKGYASLASFSKLFVLRRILVTLVAYPLSLVCWIFLVVLNRFTPVRMYRFKSPSRPGYASHHIEQLEPLCRELQNSGHKGFFIFIHASATTNLELLKLYATYFNLYLDDRAAFLRTIFSLMPKFGFTNTFLNNSYYNIAWELPPAINLSTKNKIVTPKIISRLEIEPFKFVVVTHRSYSYDSRYHRAATSDLNRSTDIGNAEDAINLIFERGLKIVRIGVDTDELPDLLKLLPIFDLSDKFRTDAQDLWLAEHCLFLWCLNDNGTWHFAHKYNRPTLVTNTYALIRGFQHSFFTFQLIWDERKNRVISLSEMATLRGIVGRSSAMKKSGLRFVENSPLELASSVAEMLNYVDNKLDHSEHDLLLLSKFSEVLENATYQPMAKGHSQPCVSFLQKHEEVLF